MSGMHATRINTPSRSQGGLTGSGKSGTIIPEGERFYRLLDPEGNELCKQSIPPEFWGTLAFELTVQKGEPTKAVAETRTETLLKSRN